MNMYDHLGMAYRWEGDMPEFHAFRSKAERNAWINRADKRQHRRAVSVDEALEIYGVDDPADLGALEERNRLIPSLFLLVLGAVLLFTAVGADTDVVWAQATSIAAIGMMIAAWGLVWKES